MRFSLVFAFVLGCYSPTPPAGVACGPEGQCPTPLMCDRGSCVAMPGGLPDGMVGDDDAPPDTTTADKDGDGVPNTDDNCADDANPDQHDEDDDNRGDVCDLCPHVAALSDPDNDGDRVGNACDPHPDTPGDAIARFIPFSGSALPADLVTLGTWTVANDQAFAVGTNTRLRLPTVYANATAEFGGIVEATQTGIRELKIVAGWTNASSWYSCCFDDTDTTNIFTFEIENENGGATQVLNVPEPQRPNKISVGPFFIRETADATANTIACSGDEGAFPISTNASAPTLSPGMIEVQATRVTYRIDYLIVISSPSP